MLREASRNLTNLNGAILKAKETASERLSKEYTRTLSGLPLAQINADTIRPQAGHVFTGGDEIPSAPVLPSDVLEEAVPESIRKAEEFSQFLEKLVSFGVFSAKKSICGNCGST